MPLRRSTGSKPDDNGSEMIEDGTSASTNNTALFYHPAIMAKYSPLQLLLVINDEDDCANTIVPRALESTEEDQNGMGDTSDRTRDEKYKEGWICKN